MLTYTLEIAIQIL